MNPPDDNTAVAEISDIEIEAARDARFDAIMSEEEVETPEIPETPEVPEVPEVPETPEVPEVPEVPETPEVPEVPETPETPEVPEVPEVDDGKQTLDPNNEWDAETIQMIQEMSNDPHAGLAFARERGKLKVSEAALAAALSDGMSSPEAQEAIARAERVPDLEVRLKEANDRLALLDFQTTPEYNQEITQPFAEIDQLAASIETQKEIPKGEILKAISATDSATQDARINNLIESYELDAREQNRIFTMADQMLHLQNKDTALRSSAQERLTQNQTQAASDQAYQTEQSRAVYRQELSKTFKSFEGKVGALVDSEGKNTAEWDSAMKESESFDFADVELQALSAYSLTIAPILASENKQLAADLAKSNTLLARYQKVTPQTPTQTATTNTPAPKANPTESISDSIGRRMREAGLG